MRPNKSRTVQGLILALALSLPLSTSCSTIRAFSPSRVYEQHPSIVPASQPAAEVYFIRESTFYASAISMVIYLDGEVLLRLRNGTYACLPIEPGLHTLGTDATDEAWYGPARGKALSHVGLDFVAGKIYFVKARPVPGSGRDLHFEVLEFVGPEGPRSHLDEYKSIYDAPSMSVE